MFNFFKKKTKTNNLQPNQHLVDGLFYITTSQELKPIKSDRFRMETESGKVQLSITNYEFSSYVSTITTEDIKKIVLPLFDDFIVNGRYIPKGDVIVGDDFIYQCFTVGEETRYILYTLKNFANKTIVSSFTISDFDSYKENVEKILFYTFYNVKAV